MQQCYTLMKLIKVLKYSIRHIACRIYSIDIEYRIEIVVSKKK